MADELRGALDTFGARGDAMAAIVDRLAKYVAVDVCPWRIPGEWRVMAAGRADPRPPIVGVEPFRPGVLPES